MTTTTTTTNPALSPAPATSPTQATNAHQAPAIVRYTPTAPVGSVGTLRALLQQQTSSLTDFLPAHLTTAQFFKTIMIAANKTPKLLDCTQGTLLESVTRAAELGLSLSGTQGEAYLIPYGKTATLILGYRGLLKLARQSGDISRVEVNVAHENDDLDYCMGTEFRLVFRPCLTGNAGKPIGAYALAQMKDGSFQAEFMTTAEIEKIRAGSIGRNSTPWEEHWDEMAKKTVFRRLAKWLPMSSEKWNVAIEHDNEGYSVSVDRGPAAADAAAARLNAPASPVNEVLFDD